MIVLQFILSIEKYLDGSVKILSLGQFFFFFFFFFCNYAFIVSKVQKALCSASYGENKTYKSKQITKESDGTG